MTAYLDSKLVELHNPALDVWRNVTSYVISDIEIDVGMKSGRVDDRIAAIGIFRFTLNDAGNVFNVKTDLAKGTKVRITFKWGSLSKLFFGIIDRVTPAVGTYGSQGIQVEVNDWMAIANNQKLRSIVVQSSKRIDQVMTTLLAGVKVQPLATSISNGIEIFPLVFDLVKAGKSTLLSELFNLVMSEFGYAYITNNGTLRIENKLNRSGNVSIPTINYTIPSKVQAALMESGGGNLLNENGGRLLLSTSVAGSYSGLINHFIGSDIKHGEDVINQTDFEVRNKVVDLSIGAYSQIYTYNLYSAMPPIPIPTLQTTVLQGEYWDEYPSYRAKIDAAMDVQDPAGPSSTYTYSGNKADLDDTFTGGADSWRWSIFNNGPPGFISYMEFFGRPIKNKQSLNSVLDDIASQQINDIISVYFKQAYLEELYLASEEAPKIIDDEATSRTVIRSVTMNANVDNNAMAAFMSTDIGSLRTIQMIKPSVDKNFYIQGMNIKIGLDLSVTYTLRLREHYSFVKGLTPIAVAFDPTLTGGKNIIIVPPHRRIANVVNKTISVWVYMKNFVTPVPLVSKWNNLAGWELWVLVGGSLQGRIQYNHKFSTTDGYWQTPLNTMDPLVNQWVHIAVTYNNSSAANDPIIYVNGVSKTITEFTAPSGTHVDESQVAMNIGNRYFAGTDRVYDYLGLIKNLQIYNTSLTPAQITTLAANPDNPMIILANLLWSGFGVKTELLDEYMNVAIPKTRRLIDNTTSTRMIPSYVDGKPLIGRDPTLSSY